MKEGSLLVTQDDIVDPQTYEVLIRKDSHLMYLKCLNTNFRDYGHEVIDATTMKRYILDAGVQIVPTDDRGTIFVLRAPFFDLPIHARPIRQGVVKA